MADFLRIEWSPPGEPLIQPPRFSPVIADPSFLFPEETPDGEWVLFAHSAWGVHRYSSIDGSVWRDRGLVVRNAMRPFVRLLGQEYLLLFESYSPLALALTALPGKRRWKSTIAASRSVDLIHWPRAVPVLEPSLPWMRDETLGESVSNPCLVDGQGERLLYFSASLSWIEDCGFCEPRYIALSRAAWDAEGQPLGELRFIAEKKPIIDPAEDTLPGVLGAGSMKVLRMEDGFIGLQNKIYRDASGRSRSAIFVLSSVDGRSWQSARETPLVEPTSGWTSSHVYACDCRYHERDGLWYLYFNARDGWRIRDGVERIGRIVGAARFVERRSVREPRKASLAGEE